MPAFTFTAREKLFQMAGCRKPIPFVIVAACLMLMVSTAVAELRIDSVYPTLGKVGQGLAVTISGEGFDQNSRVSMLLNTGNSGAIIGSIHTWGFAHDVVVSGTTAYVADLLSGLQVIDISDPVSPNTGKC